MTTIETLFEEWLNEIRPVVPLGDEGISNRERYSDIIDTLSIAFEAGFKARYKNDKLRLQALQELSDLDQELGFQ